MDNGPDGVYENITVKGADNGKIIIIIHTKIINIPSQELFSSENVI